MRYIIGFLLLAFGLILIARGSLTEIGSIQGYGQCYECGDTWNWKREHIIAYEPDERFSSGAFPLCEECFWKVSEKRLVHGINALINNWIEGGMDESEGRQLEKKLIYSAYKEREFPIPNWLKIWVEPADKFEYGVDQLDFTKKSVANKKPTRWVDHCSACTEPHPGVDCRVRSSGGYCGG